MLYQLIAWAAPGCDNDYAPKEDMQEGQPVVAHHVIERVVTHAMQAEAAW
jgi:hypothetical protein